MSLLPCSHGGDLTPVTSSSSRNRKESRSSDETLRNRFDSCHARTIHVVAAAENRTTTESTGSSRHCKNGDVDCIVNETNGGNVKIKRDFTDLRCRISGGFKSDHDSCRYDDEDCRDDSDEDRESGEDKDAAGDECYRLDSDLKSDRMSSPRPIASTLDCHHGAPNYCCFDQGGTDRHSSDMRIFAANVEREKRERRLARNRETSRVRRERERTLIEHLDRRFLFLSRQNNELRKRNEILKKALQSVGCDDSTSHQPYEGKVDHKEDPDKTSPLDAMITDSILSETGEKTQGKKRLRSSVSISKTSAKKANSENAGTSVVTGNQVNMSDASHSSTLDFITSLAVEAKGLENGILTEQLRQSQLLLNRRSGVQGVATIPTLRQSFSPDTSNFLRNSFLIKFRPCYTNSEEISPPSCRTPPVAADATEAALFGLHKATSPHFHAAHQNVSETCHLEHATLESTLERERLVLWAKAILSSCHHEPIHEGVNCADATS